MSFLKFSITILILHQLFSGFALAQTNTLRSTIEQIISRAQGDVGVAIFSLEKNDSLTVNGHGRYPMQSVYKFPVGLAVLHLVDQGKLSLDQRIFIKKSDLLPKTWSPLRDKYPNGDTAVALDEILRFTVSQSDNNGCDILFRLVGGTQVVDRFIRECSVNGISIINTEEEMSKDPQAQYRNHSSPSAMAQLLSQFYRGKILSSSSTQYLVKIMEQTTTGPKRLKGLLPKGTIVAHKTGSSGTNAEGITPATNDVGIITLPDGNHVTVVVFVSNSGADESARESVIAKVVKAMWDFYTIH